MENKPSLLYRGLKIDYENLSKFQFNGVDLKLNYEPIIDQYGRKTVLDGNEYGVYMSDNLDMIIAAYGNVSYWDGKIINQNLKIFDDYVRIPSVSVIYQINTEGLDIRKPFIIDQLKGHYNNGFAGDEWIADMVPASNYTLYRVRIGADILHDAEDVDVSKIEDVAQYVKQKLEMRKYRLETFTNDMEKTTQNQRSWFSVEEKSLLKLIYGENGLKYIDANSLITTDTDGMIKYLKVKILKENNLSVFFKSMKYIKELETQATDIKSIIELLKEYKMKNMEDQLAFEKRKKEEGKPYSTSLFESREKILTKIMIIALTRKQKDSKLQEQAQIDIEDMMLKNPEREMIKEESETIDSTGNFKTR